MLLMKRDVEDFFEEGELFEGIADKAEFFDRERAAEDLETGFFLMTDDEKFNFLLAKAQIILNLSRIISLTSGTKKILKKYKNFTKISLRNMKISSL